MAELPSLGQINNKSLRERILDTLRNAILSGELKPGQTLVETELATQLGVSRAPLREAIQILNSEGLVDTVPYHGTTVKRLTRRDIEELYSLRNVMESFAVQRIFERGTQDVTVAALRAIYQRMIAAADQGSWRDLNMIDRQFHDKIIVLSEHALLGTTWTTVQMRVQQVMSLHNMRNRDIVQVAKNHLPIMDAIEAKDLPAALAALETHIASTGDLIAEGWHDGGPDEEAS